MVPRRYSSEAIVLARRNFGEADRILVVYSKHYGKLHLIAKGVRKPKSRKRGSLEVFSHIKFAAARGKNLDIVTEVEIINSFQDVRKNLKKVAVAYFIVETVGRLTREGEKNLKLYSDILENIGMLKTSHRLRKLREQFVYDTLVLSGFWPKGKKMNNPDSTLESVVEREMNSKRVGKKLLLN